MVFIYLDESGNLGQGGSRYFIIAAVLIKDDCMDKKYRAITKKIRQILTKKKDQKMSELKFSNSKSSTICRFLKKVSELDIEVYSLILKKTGFTRKQNQSISQIYDDLIISVLKAALRNVPLRETVKVYLDKSMSKAKQQKTDESVSKAFSERRLCAFHEDSCRNPAIQATDFVCGAFGYKYNQGNMAEDKEGYIKLIKSRVKDERFY